MLIFGIKWWNKKSARLLAGADTIITNNAAKVIAAAHTGKNIAVWASREPEKIAEAVESGGGKLIRIEDGFIRSPGLGAHFCPAYSLIFDDIGIYYDAAKPSGLECLLADHPFDDALKSRAHRLKDRLIASAISKYAVGHGQTPFSPVGRERILVVGQVEDDASIRLGGAAILTNLALLKAARTDHPDAWIAYKPHPDVIHAGRPGRVTETEANQHVNAIWSDVAIAAALDWAETVHTISSLTGFEALLRERTVVVHGRPFYAGWGLTIDRAEQPERRHRTLDLDALVAATLLLYPRYLDPMTGERIEAEALLDCFEAGWTDPLIGCPLWHRTAAKVKQWLGLLRGRF